jgi:hypothetical protein
MVAFTPVGNHITRSGRDGDAVGDVYALAWGDVDETAHARRRDERRGTGMQDGRDSEPSAVGERGTRLIDQELRASYLFLPLPFP